MTGVHKYCKYIQGSREKQLHKDIHVSLTKVANKAIIIENNNNMKKYDMEYSGSTVY